MMYDNDPRIYGISKRQELNKLLISLNMVREHIGDHVGGTCRNVSYMRACEGTRYTKVSNDYNYRIDCCPFIFYICNQCGKIYVSHKCSIVVPKIFQVDKILISNIFDHNFRGPVKVFDSSG